MTGTDATPSAGRLLVVEDDPKLAAALREGLEGEGYEVQVAVSGEEGYFLATTRPFDLAVLDVMLPGRDGFEVLSTVRAHGLTLPILVLTARDALEDRVRGLDRGADDYVVKPFHFPELAARIRALLRRGRSEAQSSLAVADLHLDVARREVRRGGEVIDLTPREFELLEYLLRHKGQIVNREMLARDVWRQTMRGTPLDNVIDVHLVRLRKKVDQGSGVKLIHTVRGVGFVVREGEP